jgi:hypothetical protein
MSACQSAANVTVIDLDSVAGIGVVDDQFSGPGVDFNGTATALSGYEWLDFPTYSSDIVVCETFGGGGTIKVDTVGPPWMMAGGYVTSNACMTLTAYDSFGSRISQTRNLLILGIGTRLMTTLFSRLLFPALLCWAASVWVWSAGCGDTRRCNVENIHKE